MRQRLLSPILVVLTLLAGRALANHGEAIMEARTVDGRTVLLRRDHTWDFVRSHGTNDPANSAVLTVTDVKEMGDACGLQVRLQNNLGFKIRSLTPRFTIYNMEDVEYDSKSMSFTSIKPTKDQYKRIQFNGLGCHEIKWVQVHDAGRCTMGDIDKFNEEEGQCLSHIYVEPNTQINISK